MYYSSGNYEAFAIPKKPEGVDAKSAYLDWQRPGCTVCRLLPGA